jgi:lipoate-protein ligase A
VLYSKAVLRPIRIIRSSFPNRPVFDTAVAHALLRRAGLGQIDETLRIHVPGRMVAFGRQDTASVGYREATVAARSRGFAAVERLAGGRAAVFHPGTLAFTWTIPDPEPQISITPRFKELAEIMAEALRALGIEAQVGEVAGEYCPGAYSVNARNQKKIVGVGQRVARGAAHLGGVMVVNGSQTVRDILVPVYEAMDLPWNPQTTGSIEDELGAPRDLEKVADVLLAAFADRYELKPGALDDATIRLAEELAPDHASP